MKKLSINYKFKLIVTFMQGQFGYEPEENQPLWYKNRINNIISVIKNGVGNPLIIAKLIKNIITQDNFNTISRPPEKLSQKLFIQQDNSFDFGSKHMNSVGNHITAEVIFPTLYDSISSHTAPP